MIVDKNSLKVSIDNGSTYTSLAEYLLSAKTGYHKLWSSDSGRNLAGVQSGTLVGIFPKITCTFKPMNSTEIQTIARILDTSIQKIQYYDDNKGYTVTMDTYTGDWEVINEKLDYGESFDCAFISRRARS